MASALFSSMQFLSTKLLEAIRDTTSTSPVTDQHKSVREDLEKLSRMLARIQAVQQDAEEREIHDRSVRLWLAELRGVAYQAEDVLDEFYYELLQSIVESGDAAIEAYHTNGGNERKVVEKYPSLVLASGSSYITNISIPNGMAEKIRCITEKFEQISNDRHALQLREDDGTRLAIGPQIRPPTSSHMDERAIFGRKEEKETIISLLNLSTGPDFMVLPIVGMGGFGKTTLAQLVYNDSRICGLFNKRCWVSVSEDFDLVRLTKAIVESMSNNPCQFSELSMLQDVLKENIRGHELFLVLDDVWNEKRNLWECFRVGFFGAKFVRILTTTRITSVAKIMQTTSPFILGSLREENCWALFKHFSFGTREESENVNHFWHNIGHGIVKKCKGSPLAIKALGGILRYEMDEEKWKEILKSDISEIDEIGEIMPALRLSYKKLARHLKPCFLYLSMFPKDTPFSKDMVVRLWMAQGYINGNTRNSKTLEEMASEYFDELQGRSLVEKSRYIFDSTMYCLHDLIHDLARSISQEAYHPIFEIGQHCSGPYKVYHMYLIEQEKFMGSFSVPSNYGSIRTIFKTIWTKNFDLAILSETACVRALHLLNFSLPNTLDTFKHLRYLYVKDIQMETLPDTLCLLYNIQILHLDCRYLRELPENIKNLINLRYFWLSAAIKQLPESIFLLRNLHTLLLRYCEKLKELPRGIEQLSRLRIVDFPISHTNMPSGIGKLPTLKQLSGHFSVMDHGIIGGLRVLKDLNKLSGLLCISGLRNISDVEYSRNANLASKPNLHKLILNFQEDIIQSGRDHGPHFHLSACSSKNSRNENDENMQDVILESLQPHGNLTELAILNYGGRIFPSWLLNPLLPKLTTLTLNFYNEPNFLPPFGQLPYLRFLKISGSTGVKNVGDELSTYALLAEYGSSKQHSFPSLEVLSLRNTLNLVQWQAHDGDFPRLKELIIEHCPKLWKIATIPPEVREVTIKYCPKLELLACPSVIERLTIHECGFSEIIFGSISESLTISNCLELIAINWMDRGTNYVGEVSFKSCPKLELNVPVKDLLHSLTQRAEIYDCPRLYLGKRYIYQRDTRVEELDLAAGRGISLTSGPVHHSTILLLENPFILFLTKEDFREVESLTCAPSVGVSCQCILLNLASLVIMTISYCKKVISVAGLDNLKNLQYLSISDCQELCNWNDKILPLSLEYLSLDSCDKLSSLPLLSVQNHSSTLKVLMIKRCPRLAVLEGFHGLMKLKTVVLLRCRIISISPATESLQFLPHIIIGDCPLMRDWCQRNNITYKKDQFYWQLNDYPRDEEIEQWLVRLRGGDGCYQAEDPLDHFHYDDFDYDDFHSDAAILESGDASIDETCGDYFQQCCHHKEQGVPEPCKI